MSTPTNEQREAEIRERLSKRTPGTWKAEYITDPRGDDGGYNIIGAAGDMIANDTFGWCIDEPDDAALIADAPADLSWLLSRIEELAKERDAIRFETFTKCAEIAEQFAEVAADDEGEVFAARRLSHLICEARFAAASSSGAAANG